QVQAAATQVAHLCRTAKASGVEILGPAPAPIDRIRDRYRWQVLLKGTESVNLHRVCSEIIDKRTVMAKGDVRIAVDVDPESMI
ncbi:hypothetical protein JYT30_01235, partial [Desulfotalea psychrophila]|nr:hypothetical protein [Desulfotalea psychrophila]